MILSYSLCTHEEYSSQEVHRVQHLYSQCATIPFSNTLVLSITPSRSLKHSLIKIKDNFWTPHINSQWVSILQLTLESSWEVVRLLLNTLSQLTMSVHSNTILLIFINFIHSFKCECVYMWSYLEHNHHFY